MKTAAILAVLAAVGASAQPADPCAISCDPCADLQKQQCLGNQLCDYTVSSDSCASHDAIVRVTIEDGDEKGGVLRKRLQALGCNGFYSKKDCRTARLNGVAGGNCWWHDCDVEGNGGVPYCGEGRDATGCRPENYVLAPDKWAIDNDDCMKPEVDGTGEYSTDGSHAIWECTIGRFFDNARLNQPVFHFTQTSNYQDYKWQPRKNCPGTACPVLTTYPDWNVLKNTFTAHHKDTFLPVITDAYRVPMEATIGLFQDRGCKSGVNFYFNSNSRLPPAFNPSSVTMTNYDATHWGPLVDFYQCCSHPVLKTAMDPSDWTTYASVTSADEDLETNQMADYHNSIDDDWNSPVDPDAWEDDNMRDDGASDYLHALNGDYLYEFHHKTESEGGVRDYYNDFVVNFKITIPKPPAAVTLEASLPEDLADYTDNVFQTANRANAANNPGHPGVRSMRSVPNKFSNGDTVYLHVQGGWVGGYQATHITRGSLLYGVDAETEEQLFGIDGEKTGAPLSDDGKQQAWDHRTGGYEYSDYDGDDESDWGIRVKTIAMKNL